MKTMNEMKAKAMEPGAMDAAEPKANDDTKPYEPEHNDRGEKGSLKYNYYDNDNGGWSSDLDNDGDDKVKTMCSAAPAISPQCTPWRNWTRQ